jgi:hypothetical protein
VRKDTGLDPKGQTASDLLSRVFDLSGFVARELSGCHIALKGVNDETDRTATGDTEDEIRRSV